MRRWMVMSGDFVIGVYDSEAEAETIAEIYGGYVIETY